MNTLIRLLAYIIGYPLFHTVMKIKVVGREHLPPKGEPLILICNHFSWFELPLLIGKLPYKIIVLGSAEVWQFASKPEPPSPSLLVGCCRAMVPTSATS